VTHKPTPVKTYSLAFAIVNGRLICGGKTGPQSFYKRPVNVAIDENVSTASLDTSHETTEAAIHWLPVKQRTKHNLGFLHLLRHLIHTVQTPCPRSYLAYATLISTFYYYILPRNNLFHRLYLYSFCGWWQIPVEVI